MVDLLEKLGVNWTLLVAQLVNFVLLFMILKRFLFKPVQAILQKRASDAEKLLLDQKEVLVLQEASQKKSETVLKKAKNEAKNLLIKAEALAQANVEALLAETRVQLEQMQKQHEQKMAQEIENAHQSLKKETVTLALLLVSKILKQANQDQSSYEKILKEELTDLVLK